jgi:uncharacterized protein (DUF1501 family)
MSRRRFLHTAAGLGLSGSLPLLPLSFSTRVMAASDAAGAPALDARFLLVFLRGGYDALSLLVPTQSQLYQDVRPHIAIPLVNGDPAGARALDGAWALHPALEASMRPLYQRGQLSFVPFAGTHDTSRSHFETQDHIELGQPLGGHRSSGMLNRLTGVLHGPSAMAFTDTLPLSCQGPANVANMSLKGKPTKGLSAPLQSAVAAMYAHHKLGEAVNEGFEVRAELAQEMAVEMEAASRRAISAGGFEVQARRLARLMRERYAIGFIDVGGWDTHVNQGAASGYLAQQFTELGQGLAAIADEMGEFAWKRTVVLVVSEFGRTVKENGNRGTDHGHGSVYWVLGGGLSSTRIAGAQQAIEAATLFQGRDLPVLNEQRALLGGLLRRQFGLSAAALEQVLPGSKAQDVGLL